MAGTNWNVINDCAYIPEIIVPTRPAVTRTASDHAEVIELEGDDVLPLVVSRVQLDAVIHL